jgi:LuxR family transcriptional regulator, maltose regulon positive regulatory protein
MSVSGVSDRGGRADRPGRPVSDLVVSRLRRPPLRPGLVDRRLLLGRLSRGDDRPIVSVVAPPGYGKSTLLSQWADSSGQPFAWVTVEESDNDPKLLLTYVAEALDEIEPIDERVFDALGSPASSVPGSVVPRLASALAAMSSPVVLVLDDVHLLRNRECLSALSVLADHVPAGSRLVLAGRTSQLLRVARLRAEGRILEIGPGDLSLTAGEAASLLRHAGVVLGDEEAAELHRRTEGWAAGLYIAALAINAGSHHGETPLTFTGSDVFMRDYLRPELLDRLPASYVSFLTRTAAVDRMSGPLCDALLERRGSAVMLAGLAQSNLLVVPLDRKGQWYRYHHLFRDLLLAELDRLEPGQIPALKRRAAQWHEADGQPAEALEYWTQAGDADSAARLVTALALPAYQRGMAATAQRWFRWLEDYGDMKNYPAAAAVAAQIAAFTGKPGDAERWAQAAEQGAAAATLPDGNAALQPWLALVRALLCRDGPAQMQADAELAAATMAAGSFSRTLVTVYLGLAHLMAGEPDKADVLFADAIAEGLASGIAVGPCVALAERSLLAIAGGEQDTGEQYLDARRQARRPGGVHHRARRCRADRAASRRQAACPQGTSRGAASSPGTDLRHPVAGRPCQAGAGRLPPRAARPGRSANPAPRDRPDPPAAARPRRVRPPGRPAARPGQGNARLEHPRRVRADHRRTATAAPPVHPSVIPGDRRGTVPVPQHHQVTGVLDVPQAGGLQPQPGSHAIPQAWSPRGVMAALPVWQHRARRTRSLGTARLTPVPGKAKDRRQYLGSS